MVLALARPVRDANASASAVSVSATAASAITARAITARAITARAITASAIAARAINISATNAGSIKATAITAGIVTARATHAAVPDVPVMIAVAGLATQTGTFLEATVRWATPFALAAVGECISERAGVINIGLEGSIICGALGATIGATAFGIAAGFLVGALCGLSIGALFGVFAVMLRADQIITGTAITMFGLGLTGTVYRIVYGAAGAALTTPTSPALSIPGLSAIPIVGDALFTQPPITYALYVLVPLVALWLSHTQAGLSLRAVGERPDAAIAAGIRPRLVQMLAVLFAGAMAGLAGATLVLAQAGTFVEGMSAGRGFIAIAIVVLGRWRPLGVAVAALIFGAAYTLQNVFQSMGWQGVPYNLFLAVPYVLTLVVLATARSTTAAPAALGQRDIG